MDDITPISLRCPSDLAEKLRVQGALHRRSRHAEILALLEAGIRPSARITEAMLRTNPVDPVQVAAMANAQASSTPPHDFTPRRGNALKCAVCGGRGRGHA